MTTHAHLSGLYRKRARTRSSAFILAVTAFVAIKLVTLGAVSRADTAGMEMLDVDCAEQSTSLAC